MKKCLWILLLVAAANLRAAEVAPTNAPATKPATASAAPSKPLLLHINHLNITRASAAFEDPRFALGTRAVAAIGGRQLDAGVSLPT